MPAAGDQQAAVPIEEKLPELTPPEFHKYNRLADLMNRYVRPPLPSLN